MELLTSITAVLHTAGLTFGVGSSTFALIFYIKALEDHKIDASEKSFMHIVYVVLRIGMVLITLSLISFAIIWFYTDKQALLFNPVYVMEWILIGVIIINAMLMTIHKMPMWLGPSLAGGSWYFLFLITTISLENVEYATFISFYMIFVVIFLITFNAIKKHYIGT